MIRQLLCYLAVLSRLGCVTHDSLWASPTQSAVVHFEWDSWACGALLKVRSWGHVLQLATWRQLHLTYAVFKPAFWWRTELKFLWYPHMGLVREMFQCAEGGLLPEARCALPLFCSLDNKMCTGDIWDVWDLVKFSRTLQLHAVWVWHSECQLLWSTDLFFLHQAVWLYRHSHRET